MATEPSDATWTVDVDPDARTLEDVELGTYDSKHVWKFVAAFAIGAFFFLLPVPWQGEITVPFDIVVSNITERFPGAVGVYALLIIVAGGVLTTLAEFDARGILDTDTDLSYFESSVAFWALRVMGLLLAPVMFFKLGPEWLHTPGTGGFMWGTLIYSVGVIIPIGAIFITIFVELGGLEFVGASLDP